MKTYEIWIEGAATNGDRSQASLVGTVDAEDFIHACLRWYLGPLSDSWRKFKYRFEVSHDGVPSVWGCRLFDNEADARKSFG